MVYLWQSKPRYSASRTKGFTLVEVLVVAPMVILMLGAIIAMIINLSTSAMRAGAHASLQNDVLLALDTIERDIQLTTKLSDSTTTQLVLENLATSRNPFDAERRLIDASNCSVATQGVAASSALRYTIRYRVNGTKLERVPTFPSGCAQTSSNIWQTREVEQLIDVKMGGSITLSVVKDAGASPRGAKVGILAVRTVAGETISFFGSIYVESLNIQ